MKRGRGDSKRGRDDSERDRSDSGRSGGGPIAIRMNQANEDASEAEALQSAADPIQTAAMEGLSQFGQAQ